MNRMREAAERYLAIRRSMGYKLKVEGRMLGQFSGFLEQRGTSCLTVKAALEWATLPAENDAQWWAARLTVARGFARFLATLDEHTEIPPTDLRSMTLRHSFAVTTTLANWYAHKLIKLPGAIETDKTPSI